MGMILSHAQFEGRLMVNPFAVRRVKIPGKKRGKVDVPNASDMRALMAFMNRRKPPQRSHVSWSSLRVAIMLASSAGLRAEEICALTWDRIDPISGDIYVREAIVGGFGPRLKVSLPKTEDSIRTVPLTHAARQVLNEHAHVYTEFYGSVKGWPVGYVVKPSRVDAKFPFLSPHQLSFMFRNILREAGIVDENGKQKMHFHQLRHWFGAIAVKYHSDNHYVRKLMGHKHLSMTLDTYAGYVDSPRSREEFLAMPDPLALAIEDERATVPAPRRASLPAPASAPMPEIVNGEASAVVVEEPCPYPVPANAPDWIRKYARLLDQGFSMVEICREVRTSPATIDNELRRWRLPKHTELRRELRERKMRDLIDQGMGDAEIAIALGYKRTYRTKVWDYRQKLLAQRGAK
jgi:integrase